MASPILSSKSFGYFLAYLFPMSARYAHKPLLDFFSYFSNFALFTNTEMQ